MQNSRNLLVILFIISALWSSSTSAGSLPSSEELWNHVRFVHLTNYLKDHTVTPGSSATLDQEFFEGRPGSAQEFNALAQYPLAIQMKSHGIDVVDPHLLFVRTRITTHWSPFEAAEMIWTPTGEGRRLDDRSIAIIEPAKHFKGQLWGGKHDDLIVVGPHSLSRDAYIIVSETIAAQVKADNPNYQGHYWIYPPGRYKSVRDAVADLNKIIRDAYPDSWAFTSAKLPQFMTARERLSYVNEVLDLIQLMDMDQINSRLENSMFKNASLAMSNLVCHLSKGNGSPAALSKNCHPAALSKNWHVAEEYFKNFIAKVETSHGLIYWNHDPYFAVDFFGAWIRNDEFVWSVHDTSAFMQLESATRWVFEPEQVMTLNAMLQPSSIDNSLKLTASLQAANQEVSDRDIENVRQAIVAVEALLVPMSAATKLYFAKHKKILETNLTRIESYRVAH